MIWTLMATSASNCAFYMWKIIIKTNTIYQFDIYTNLTWRQRLTFLVVVLWVVRSKDLDSLLKRISTASLMASTSKGNLILPSRVSCHIAVFLAAIGSEICINAKELICQAFLHASWTHSKKTIQGSRLTSIQCLRVLQVYTTVAILFHIWIVISQFLLFSKMKICWL